MILIQINRITCSRKLYLVGQTRPSTEMSQNGEIVYYVTCHLTQLVGNIVDKLKTFFLYQNDI